MDAITSVLKDWDKEVLQDSSLVYDSKRLVNQLNNVIPVFGEYGLKYNTDALDSSSDWSLLNDNSIYVFKDLGKNAPALGNNKKGILIVVGDKSNEAQFVFTPHQMMCKTEGAWQKLLNTDDLQNIVNNYVKTSDTANWQKQKIFADNDWKLTTCPSGTNFGKFLQSSSVPIGFSIVRDDNNSYDFMTIKESASCIYAISTVGSTDSSQLCTYRILNNVDQGYQYYKDMNGVADAGFLYNADGSLKWSLLASEGKDFSKEVYDYIVAKKPATAFYVEGGTTGLPVSSSARGLILPSHDGAGVAIMIGDNGAFYVGQADGSDPNKTANWWKVPSTNANTGKLLYKTVSSTLYTQMDISDTIINTVKKVGADLVMPIMATVTSNTDPNITMQDNSKVISNIKRIQAAGIGIKMLKPHIGPKGGFDGLDRSTYNPSDYDLFFSNWKNLMLNYAKICNDYGIPILSLGCEQKLNTDPKYLPKWKDIIDTLKNLYPNILLTYSGGLGSEVTQGNNQIYQYLDLIAVTVYPSYIQRLWDSSVTLDELIKGWYRGADGVTQVDNMNQISEKYHKPIFIAETGTMPYLDGLMGLISQMRDTSSPVWEGQALGYQATLEMIKQEPNIIGVSFWNTNAPFQFSNLDNPDEVTPTMQVLMDYFKGGKI